MKYTYLIAILFLGLLFTCNKAFGTEKEDSELLGHVLTAMRYWGLESQIPPYPVRMVEVVTGLPQSEAGCMTRPGFTGGWLEVRRDFYRSASKISLMYALVHEVGHCSFGLPHNARRESIMYALDDKTELEKMQVLMGMLQYLSRKGAK